MTTIHNTPGSESTDEQHGWDVKELSKPQRAGWNQTITYDDYLKLLKGFRPLDMDDRWVLTCDELNSETNRGAAHLYRSWTGYEDLRGEFFLLANVEPQNSKAPYVVFDRIWWETDSERRGEQTEDEAKALFVALLRGLVGVIPIDRDQAKVGR